MSIRKTLLLAFLLVGVTPAVVLALLAFHRASLAVQAEIEQGLAAQADALLSDVSKLMYERLQNAATWRRIEVMQDLRVGDVDKRLADFLRRLALGYGGLYRELSALDTQGRVVASSDAARIGGRAEAPAPWQEITLGGSRITLDLPARQAGETAVGVSLRTPIASAFGEGALGELGELQLRLDWTEVDRMLEQAAVEGRMVALLDAQGRLVAGSKRLLALLPRLQRDLAAWVQGPPAGPHVLPANGALAAQPMFAGVGRPREFAGFKGLGWNVLVLVPREEALAPVRSMALMFGALLGVVVLLTLLASGAVSQAIARPIVALTHFSRNYKHQKSPQTQTQTQTQEHAHSGEIGELRQAFLQMVQEIDQSQQQLARAAALVAVGEMSAVIAHEVRTPLGIVLSSAQILQREAHLSAEGQELLGFIESETTRLGRLVSAMLESTRPRAPQPVPTDMAALIAHTVALLTAQAGKLGVQINTQLGARNEPIDCDPEQMTQVLLNVILNGLQMLGQGGQISISTADVNDQLIIDIADNGPGIAPEARARVFEAFYFQREGGIGLGLAVVHKVITAHGGQIEARESALGGALFRIQLPRRFTPSETRAHD